MLPCSMPPCSTLPSSTLPSSTLPSSTLQQFYSILAASLQNGTSTRPGLPTELIILIMRLADCVLLSMYTRVSTENLVVRSMGSSPNSQACLLSDPVSQRMVSRLAKMRLTTNSHDQGWCNYPSRGTWTWFEISLVERVEEDGGLRVKKIRREDTSNAPEYRLLSCISHRNRQASSQFCVYEGAEFGPDHEIWSHISEGDRILVRAFAQYPGWTNYVDWCVLKLWEWYDPTS